MCAHEIVLHAHELIMPGHVVVLRAYNIWMLAHEIAVQKIIAYASNNFFFNMTVLNSTTV